MELDTQQTITYEWFVNIRNEIRESLEKLEEEFSVANNLIPGKFQVKPWERNEGGGGEISIIKGNLFEKGGVNVSAVWGEFSPEFRKQIPGAEINPKFFATGVSLVIHPKSPMIPIVHMNTRYISTTKTWFGGGADLTPIFIDVEDKNNFHATFKEVCDKYNPDYYPNFKKQCDEYFFLPNRNEPRGIGGIFYDYLNTGNFENDFNFTKEVAIGFKEIYPKIVKKHMFDPYGSEEKKKQLIKRGRYVEFNLIYDRGTKFGLMTGGNTEAILMSLPPEAHWD
ncbi:MAG: oxygen-dependent coproporphyrinogen oxidase [Sphingobacteriia bacterium]|nr:oxygen-dependent coproporphyrinogen oxidase [Sphingobacteriia bacterium]